MHSVGILEAIRSPIGRVDGRLAPVHPVDLLGAVLRSLEVDPASVGQLVVGCATQAGGQSANVAHGAVLAAGWPETIVARTVDQGLTSSHAALHLAIAAVASGSVDTAVAAGVDSATLIPPGSAALARQYGRPYGPGVEQQVEHRGGLLPPGDAADRVARAAGLTIEDLDAFADRSRRRRAEPPVGGDPVVPITIDDRLPPVIDDELVIVDGGSEVPLQLDGLHHGRHRAAPADAAAAVVVSRSPSAALFAVSHAAAGAAFDGASPAALDPSRSLLTGLGRPAVLFVDETWAGRALTTERALEGAIVDTNPSGGDLATGRSEGAGCLQTVARACAHVRHTGEPGLVATEGHGLTGMATLIAPR